MNEIKEYEGFEWDEQAGAYFDLTIGDFVSAEKIDRVYYVTCSETGEPERRFSDPEDEWQRVDRWIKQQKEMNL
jgi:hypothetical protein